MDQIDHHGLKILEELLSRCKGAYSDVTLRGYRNDLVVFKSWCAERGASWLPADPETIAQFVDDEAPTKAIATVKRRICAIQFAHRILDLPSPIQNHLMEGNLERLSRAVGTGAMALDGVAVEVALGPQRAVLTRAESERQAIAAALEAANGHRIRAAEMLKMSRTTLYRRMKEYGME